VLPFRRDIVIWKMSCANTESAAVNGGEAERGRFKNRWEDREMRQEF